MIAAWVDDLVGARERCEPLWRFRVRLTCRQGTYWDMSHPLSVRLFWRLPSLQVSARVGGPTQHDPRSYRLLKVLAAATDGQAAPRRRRWPLQYREYGSAAAGTARRRARATCPTRAGPRLPHATAGRRGRGFCAAAPGRRAGWSGGGRMQWCSGSWSSNMAHLRKQASHLRHNAAGS